MRHDPCIFKSFQHQQNWMWWLFVSHHGLYRQQLHDLEDPRHICRRLFALRGLHTLQINMQWTAAPSIGSCCCVLQLHQCIKFNVVSQKKPGTTLRKFSPYFLWLNPRILSKHVKWSHPSGLGGQQRMTVCYIEYKCVISCFHAFKR